MAIVGEKKILFTLLLIQFLVLYFVTRETLLRTAVPRVESVHGGNSLCMCDSHGDKLLLENILLRLNFSGEYRNLSSTNYESSKARASPVSLQVGEGGRPSDRLKSAITNASPMDRNNSFLHNNTANRNLNKTDSGVQPGERQLHPPPIETPSLSLGSRMNLSTKANGVVLLLGLDNGLIREHIYQLQGKFNITTIENTMSDGGEAVPTQVPQGYPYFSVFTTLRTIDPRSPTLISRFESYVYNNSRHCSGKAKEVYLRDLHALGKNQALSIGRTEQHRWANKAQTTLMTQLSYQRIGSLWRMMRHWKGPLVAVVTCSLSDLWFVYSHALENLLASSRKNVFIIIVGKEKSLYPVNWLRNLGIKYAFTNYIFMLDVDFVPSRDLDSVLKEYTDRGIFDSFSGKVSLVVPAFELKNSRLPIPGTKAQLIEHIDKNEASPFHVSRLRGALHGRTNYTRWYSSTKPYPATKGPCFYYYEPYLALAKSKSPYLPETLLQRYHNKVAYYAEMCYRKYHFEVIPDGFVLHLPHHAEPTSEINIKGCADSAWWSYRNFLIHHR